MLLVLSMLTLVAQTASAVQAGVAARNPAYARDGRLAVSVQGDLWIVSARGEWTKLTSGPAWDREPAWTPDGRLVFAAQLGGTVSARRNPRNSRRSGVAICSEEKNRSR